MLQNVRTAKLMSISLIDENLVFAEVERLLGGQASTGLQCEDPKDASLSRRGRGARPIPLLVATGLALVCVLVPASLWKGGGADRAASQAMNE